MLADRRGFLLASAASLAAGLGRPLHHSGLLAAQRPPVRNPRATDGDDAFEPDWDQRLTITVGPNAGGPKQADLVGQTDKVLQAAVDYVARLGGGTVQILPGEYTLRNAIHLPSKIRLLGSGADSVLTKIPSRTVELSDDSDWDDQEITLADSKGFQVGDGILLRSTASDGSSTIIKRTLVAKSGNRFKLNDGLRKNLWLSAKPTCSSLFPLLTSEYTSDVVIENLTLDGNREKNVNLDGNYAGCIFLQDCNRYTIRGVEARNYNGDGISFQICHDVVVENCHSHDNADLGVHPGSGSQRPLIRNCKLERNTIGIFWCWGVKFGLAENNRIDGNRSYGMSIGHNDTDNVMRNNDISNSGKIGILFRDDPRGQDFWANRNVVENNRISDSGDADGVAIDIQGQTKDVKIIGNTLSETRGAMQRIGVRIGPQSGHIELAENSMQGFSKDVEDLRTT